MLSEIDRRERSAERRRRRREASRREERGKETGSAIRHSPAREVLKSERRRRNSRIDDATTESSISHIVAERGEPKPKPKPKRLVGFKFNQMKANLMPNGFSRKI